ncbi:MAG: AraC family transcriptional regulator [Mitsuaria chitosanitabida]|uniref:AraC family transcriptional regulator n=1 Tax=Roseateles chitosanitabidus TaxID=65048 RepID=UPI001B02E289|nr:AraC family transcriptional regulator [Roseateles chitosanitabidus]MBO9687208.1 AraC family transcriptional regulator [Roseateles chitosanitabidus]
MPASSFTLLPSRLVGIEVVRADTARAFARHVHDQFGIGLIDRGAQKSASGRGMVEAGAGDLITVNPGEVHDGTPIGDHGRSWRMLYLDPERVFELAADVTGRAVSREVEFTRPTLKDTRLARRFEALFPALIAAPTAAPSMQAESALLMLLADLLSPRSGDAPIAAATITPARARLDDDPASEVDLATLAADAGLSRFQFLRAFSRATGLTPHAYLIQRRLQRARALIARGLPLADAAAASGFCDQSHLTRHFVRCFGLSPGAYARSVR